MSTIAPLPSSYAGASALSPDALGRSLSGLTARTRSAVSTSDADGDADTASAEAASTALGRIARQNQLSVLADSGAAATANASAVAAMAASPASALSTQGGLAPQAVLGLLSSS